MSKKASAAATAPTRPGADPETEEMTLELAADEAFIGADEMQHLDDLAVRRHGAPRRGDDDGDGRRGDEREHGEAADRRRSRQCLDLGLPAAVIVEGDAFEILRECVLDEFDVWRITDARSYPAAVRSTNSPDARTAAIRLVPRE